MARLARIVEALSGETLLHYRLLPTQLDWVDEKERHMRRAMTTYTQWERGRPPKSRAPELPRLKSPPAWLKARLVKAGRFNAAKDQVLQTELAQWKQSRGL